MFEGHSVLVWTCLVRLEESLSFHGLNFVRSVTLSECYINQLLFCDFTVFEVFTLLCCSIHIVVYDFDFKLSAVFSVFVRYLEIICQLP